jgi:hypothetical protein
MKIELSPYDLAIIAGGFGIVGTLIGAFLTYRLAVQLSSRQAFNKAASTFRSAFTKEIRLIEESTVETDFIEMFNNAYIRHYNAVISFMPYLSESKRAEIKKAWENHCYPKGLERDERILLSANFIHYDHHQGIEIVNKKPHITEDHGVSFERAKALVTKNLDSILSFAKFK